jgi:hypothetical protein
LQSQLTPPVNIIAFMSRLLCCLKSQKRKFYCPLMIFLPSLSVSMDCTHLWMLIAQNLLLTIMKNFIEWIFKSVECLFIKVSDLNDLNCNNLKFTTAYLTDACVGALNSIFQKNKFRVFSTWRRSFCDCFDDAENLFIFNAWVVKILNVH